jgi:sigma-B regulation protein RsbU (phosphoserine phosphatase)
VGEDRIYNAGHMRFRTLSFLASLISLGLIAAVVFAAVYQNAEARSSETGTRLLLAANSHAGGLLGSQGKQAADLTRTLVGLGSGGLALEDSGKLLPQLVSVLRANGGITWVSYSDAAGTFTGVYRNAQGRVGTNQSRIVGGKTAVEEYLLGEDGGRTLVRKEEDSGYDPRTRPFYREAAAARGVVWSPPYIFFGPGIPGVSCAMAVRDAGGEVQGVVSVDYDLNRLSEMAEKIAVSPHSEVMAFTSDLTLVGHSTVRVEASNGKRGVGKLLTLKDVSDPVTRTFYGHLADAGRLSVEAGHPRSISFEHEKRRYIGCIERFVLDSGPGLYVATVAPLDDFAPPAWHFARSPILITAAALVLAAALALFLANRVSHPLTALMAASERIGKGELDVNVNLGRLYEFKRLSKAFHRMLANLREWVRLRMSLALAMEVQRRLLPAAPPVVPGFDIAGYCAYCDDTGGDYYDFIVVDRSNPQRFMVAIGDVMGHGLPSALLMAGARGILRSVVSDRAAPGPILTRMNSLLFEDTGGDRFMTMCLASFDMRCSGCIWASAGHEPPVIFDPVDRVFMELEGGDIPLGIMDAVEYGNHQFGPLSRNIVVYIGTDGVWETLSPEGEKYGRVRLKRVIAANAEGTAEDMKQAILASLHEFRRDADCRDDVTFVIIKEGMIPAGGAAWPGAPEVAGGE